MPEIKPRDRSPLTLAAHYGRLLAAAIATVFDAFRDRRFWALLAGDEWGGNRWSDQFQQSLIRGLWTFFADVQFNGAGTPTLVQATYVNNSSSVTWATAGAKGSKTGALTFTRSGTGDYTLTFSDKWIRVLNYSPMFLASGNAAAPISQVKVASNPNAAGSTTGMGWTGASGSPSNNAVELLFFSAQGTVADPAATEMAVLSFQIMASTAN